MQGRCIQAPDKSNLVEGEIYYLFPHGGLAYNVSRFPHPGAHFGTYQKSRFEIIVEEDVMVQELKRPDKLPVLKSGKVYEAELIWKSKGAYAPLGKYYITSTEGCYANEQDCYFYDDSKLQKARGRYPIQWFTNLKEFGTENIKELPRESWKQMDLFNIDISSELV